MDRKRILVIEDDAKSQYALVTILQEHGHDVRAFASAEDAEGVDAGTIDAAIIDVRLPKKHGAEFAKELKEKNPRMTIVFVTAYDGLEKMGGGLDGATLMVKPIDIDVLLKLL